MREARIFSSGFFSVRSLHLPNTANHATTMREARTKNNRGIFVRRMTPSEGARAGTEPRKEKRKKKKRKKKDLQKKLR